MDQLFLFVSSDDSNTIFPGNDATKFTVQLPRLIDLKGTWVCGLTEISLKNNFITTPRQVIVSSDLIEESFIRDTQWPVLRRVVLKPNEDIDFIFSDPYYHKIVQKQAHRIHIYLRDQNLQKVQLSSGELSCVLHLKRIA